MPTATKLVAAAIFALIGLLTADTIVPLLDEGTPTRRLYQLSLIIPLICGWRVMGRLAGTTYPVAINSAFYALAVSVFFVLFTIAVSEMLKRSTRGAYDGPVDAVVQMFGIIVEYGVLLLNYGPLSVMIPGAIIAGLVCEWTHRRWP